MCDSTIKSISFSKLLSCIAHGQKPYKSDSLQGIMDIRERNRKNVLSRWEKHHKKEKEFIEKNKFSTSHLKARLCGFLAGDGNILVSGKGKNKHNTIRFFPDDKSLIESFEEAVQKVYNQKIKIKEARNHFIVTVDSKSLVEDLLSISKFGIYTWEIPKMLNSLTTKTEWLRAFFDCEAHVNQRYIRIQSVNRKGLLEVKKLLTEFQVQSKLYEYSPKNPKHHKVYILNISKKEDRKRYAALIGFNHNIKLKKLDETLLTNATIA